MLKQIVKNYFKKSSDILENLKVFDDEIILLSKEIFKIKKKEKYLLLEMADHQLMLIILLEN